MMYEDVVRDFARRTLRNVEYIEHASGRHEPVLEATQLINSMLGLLVLPQQEFFESLPMMGLEGLVDTGWPIPQVTGDFEQVVDLKQRLHYLRNAVAHFNLEFIGDGTNTIGLLRVWNQDPRSGKTTWKAELSLDDLRGITSRFIELVLRDS